MSRRLNVFFIHAKWLKDRERVVSEFQKLTGKYVFKDIKGVKIRVITDFDPNDINHQIISSTVNYSPVQDNPNEINEKKLSNYNGLLRNLHIFQLSNTLKHYKALEEIVNSSNENDINLVLEDDILYEDKMCMMLERLVDNLPSDFDMVFLGLPNNINTSNKTTVRFQATKDLFRVLPYCDSYIVSKTAARKLYDNYLPIKFVNNVQLSYMIEKLELNSLIAIPNIFMDGTKFGVFLSVLTPSNQLLFNNDYMTARAILSNENVDVESQTKLDNVFANSLVRNHPDMMHLKGLYLSKHSNYNEAKDVFESALKIYQDNNCVLNHESQFLKDYIKMYKDIQDI